MLYFDLNFQDFTIPTEILKFVDSTSIIPFQMVLLCCLLSSVNASILYMELILEYFTEDIRPVASSPPSFVSAPASSFSPAPSCPALHGHAHVPSIKLVLQSELFSHPVSATETARVLLSKDPGRQAGRRLRLQVHVHSLCDLTATANR